MSFSTEIKEELSKISNLTNKQCVNLELIGYMISANVSIVNKNVRFSTESQYNINRFAKLLNNIDVNDYQIEIQGKNYIITSNHQKLCDFINQNNITQLNINEDIEKKAFVRGCFLGSGSINNPKKQYHIEIIIKEKEDAEFVIQLLKQYDINFKPLEKKNGVSIYSKDGEEISKFLAFIGASSAVLKFEDIRVYRDMRNNVNRLVNCETANLSKTVNASIKQIEAINYIKKKGKFTELSDNLQEIAELRIENPEASLIELGKMANPSIGKSAVNYRLRTIIKYAEELT